MSKIKNSNYVVVTGWMLNELKLSGAELMIFATIYGFSQDGESKFDGSIQYLADWANASKRHTMRCLSELEAKGYIVKHESMYHNIKMNSYTVSPDVTSGDKMSSVPVTKCQGGGDKMSPNNLVDNTTDTPVKREINKEKPADIPYQEIVDHLNLRTGAHYKASSQKTRDLIKARFNQGFTFEDFVTVIDKKTVQWINDPKYCSYLRPETLFGTKFEGYLNQPMKKKQTLNDIDIDMGLEDMWDFDGGNE